MLDLSDLKNDFEGAKQTLTSIQNNTIHGMDLGDFIYNKLASKFDPIQYIERVLRAHLPESKRHLHENQIELVRAVCNPKIRKVAALMARQCFAKGTQIRMADDSLKPVELIKLGDRVKTPAGNASVIFTTSGVDQLYKIKPNNCQEYIVTGNHKLAVCQDNIITLLPVHKIIKKYGYTPPLRGCYIQNDIKQYYQFTIEKYIVDKYYGFTIDDSINIIYIKEDNILTGNSGKTESIASFSGYLLDNYPNMRIGIFTPRVQQAEVNVGRTSIFFQMNEDKLNNKLVKCTKQKIELSNGSYVSAVSGSDQSNIEGLTFDVIVLDEAQKISNYTWSERISPMGGATNAKLIKIGTPKFRNHFYDSMEGKGSSEWCTIKRDWTRCPQLWALDATILPDHEDPTHTRERPYSTFVLTLMPKSLKQEYFPTRPDVWTEGQMSVEDFKTQYMLEFVDGAAQFLTTEECEQLKNGEFDWLTHGQLGETYFAGIDFAGSGSDTADFTHISVIRLDERTNQKQKVFAYEMQGVSYPEQIRQIEALFGGMSPRFICKRIFADFTGCGRPVVETLIQECGLTQMTGITFNASDTFTHTGMNLKNAMYAYAKQEIDYDRFKYPSLERYTASAGKENVGFWHKMIGEWSDLECEQKISVNKRISAPSGSHDDVTDSDACSVFASLNNGRRKMPRPVFARMSR